MADLVWDGMQWYGTFQICDHIWAMKLTCTASGSPSSWTCTSDGCVFQGYVGNFMSGSCSPFQLVFNWSWTEHCCPGNTMGSNLTLTVTK